jgi:hypothetical protein
VQLGTRSNARWRESVYGGCMDSLYQSRQERVSLLEGCREWGSLSCCLEVLRRVEAPATPGAQTVLGKRDASLPRPSPTDGPRLTTFVCLRRTLNHTTQNLRIWTRCLPVCSIFPMANACLRACRVTSLRIPTSQACSTNQRIHMSIGL